MNPSKNSPLIDWKKTKKHQRLAWDAADYCQPLLRVQTKRIPPCSQSKWSQQGSRTEIRAKMHRKPVQRWKSIPPPLKKEVRRGGQATTPLLGGARREAEGREASLSPPMGTFIAIADRLEKKKFEFFFPVDSRAKFLGEKDRRRGLPLGPSANGRETRGFLCESTTESQYTVASHA